MTDLSGGILGIDISKAKFDVALMAAGKVKKTHIFENSPDGFQTLSNWLLKQGITTVAACMEATGCYGDALATYLYDQGIEVSVVNPAQIKSFSGAQLKRAKTDKADAKLIEEQLLLTTRCGDPAETNLAAIGGGQDDVRALQRRQQVERLARGQVRALPDQQMLQGDP